MAIVSYNLRINGCQIIQPGIAQTQDGCVYPACALHMSYCLRKMFAQMKSPYQPAEGCMVNPYKWQEQLLQRGFDTNFVWHLICEVRDYSGVPLTQVKLRHVAFAPKGESDKSPAISIVCQMLERKGEHAMVLLAFRKVVGGDKLAEKVPPGSYYIFQDSNAMSAENPRGLNLMACDHLIEAYAAVPEFPYADL